MKLISNLSRPITLVGILFTSVAFQSTIATAATISNITALTLGAETSGGTTGTINGVTYQGLSKPITSIAVGGANWDINGAVNTTLILQRGATSPDPNKQVVWERCTTNCNSASNVSATVIGGAPTTTAATLAQNNIYSGTDNLFTNSGSGQLNQSNVERADFNFSTSYAATNKSAIAVLERGVANAHDNFAIAAITGFDASKNPIYDKLIGVPSGWGATSLLPSANQTYRVLNDGAGTGSFSLTSGGTQDIGGLLIPLDLLVTAPNSQVYGYSIFAYDTYDAVTAGKCSQAQLSSISNTNCFIANTLDAKGGIDLIAANLGVSQLREASLATAVPEPFTLIGTAIGGMAALCIKKKLKSEVK